MTYDFIAEFYRDSRAEEPSYKTHVWGLSHNDERLKELGFTVDPDSTPGYIDYMKEIKSEKLVSFCSFEDNPELADIFFEGKKCNKVILHAYESEPESMLGCTFGAEKALWAQFTGNRPESRVSISRMHKKPVVDLPLRCFKEKMGVITLFEVMDKLQKDFNDYSAEDLEKIKEQFSSGMDRAIEIVSHAFAEDLDLDGNPQLLHMTAVSSAGQTDDERLVGMLHDLVEDTDWTFDKLLSDGFPERIVDTLRLLTHDKQTPYMDYINNICESGNKVALAVKTYDLNHNLKRGRAGGHWEHVAKHEKALTFIQEYIDNGIGNE